LATTELSFRDGSATDLAETFAISERAVYDAAARQGILPAGREPTDADIRGDWLRQRALIEFIAAQPGGRYEICEEGTEAIGYARTVRFGEMEELTELMVRPDRQGQGIGRALLERCWPGDPSPQVGRIVIAAGAPADLSLYTAFGVMPVAGHWHMRLETDRYLEARAVETEETRPAHAHVLEPDHAVSEWNRLEPGAIGHPRPLLHEFFGRDRTCLATLDGGSGQASALCWVSGEGDIGPAVGAWPKDVVPIVLAALDRVARIQEPEHVSVFTTTISWWLLTRLRGLGFRVWWPSWIMCSVPLPGLDRYAPTRPPQLL
jgi:GNAT superfamily N-acetyltransferase